MGRGLKLTDCEQFTIKVMKERGDSISKIAQSINRSRKVVKNFLDCPEKYGTSYKGRDLFLLF